MLETVLKLWQTTCSAKVPVLNTVLTRALHRSPLLNSVSEAINHLATA